MSVSDSRRRNTCTYDRMLSAAKMERWNGCFFRYSDFFFRYSGLFFRYSGLFFRYSGLFFRYTSARASTTPIRAVHHRWACRSSSHTASTAGKAVDPNHPNHQPSQPTQRLGLQPLMYTLDWGQSLCNLSNPDSTDQKLFGASGDHRWLTRQRRTGGKNRMYINATWLRHHGCGCGTDYAQTLCLMAVAVAGTNCVYTSFFEWVWLHAGAREIRCTTVIRSWSTLWHRSVSCTTATTHRSGSSTSTQPRSRV